MQKDRPVPSDDQSLAFSERARGIEAYIANGLDLICALSEDGCLLRANPAFERTVGRSKPEIIGRRISEFIHPDDIGIAGTMAVRIAAGESINHFPIRLCAPDGSCRWVGWSAYRSEGVTFAVGRDITEHKQAEEELAETRALLQAVLSQSPVPVVVARAPANVVWFGNQALADLYGVASRERYEGLAIEQVVEERPWQALHTDRTPVALDDMPLSRALQGVTVRSEEGIIVRPDGSERWVLATGAPIYDSARKLIAGLVMYSDVTEIKRADATLRLVNRQLQMISDCNQALIRATDECELLATVCSIAVTIGGYRMAWVGFAEDDADKTVRPVAHAGFEDGYLENRWSWADDEFGRSTVGVAIRSGRPSSTQRIAIDPAFARWQAAALGRGFAAACSLPLTAGTRTFGVLTVYSSSTDAFHPKEVELLGELAGDLGFGIQVLRTRNEGARAEENLRASEERFKRMLEHSNDIVVVTDENLILSTLFGPVERMLGRAPEELIGTSGFDRMHSDDLPQARRALGGVVSAPGSTARAEFRVQDKYGDWVPFEAIGVNLLDDPTVRGVVINIRNITERKLAEAERVRLQAQLQQAMKMEAVGRLAGGVAHDFNNLLTAISGNLELARLDVAQTDPLMPYLEAIGRAAESAAALTQQLLAFSRRQIIEPRVLNLNDLVANLRRMATRLIGEDIEIRTRLAPDLGTVKVDPGQFEQVLLNLVVNARDAMLDGGILLIETANVGLDAHYCVTHSRLQPGPFVMLAVSDTGCGMSDDVKQRLFEPFFTTKPKGKGTGLGLATIFGAVQQANGAIEVYSEVGQGTTFKIYLPRAGAVAEMPVREKLPSDAPHGHETVLLVEDEASVRDVALAVLTRLGYRVLTAANADEALTHAATDGASIDLLMTDVVMPGMNGRELAELLVKAHPRVKVLFTSGYTEDVIVHHGVVDENLDFIGKPYSLAGLAAKVRETIDRQPRQDRSDSGRS
jgi:two-component system, cell cycle sensor histidine kinase and response regulator CckA